MLKQLHTAAAAALAFAAVNAPGALSAECEEPAEPTPIKASAHPEQVPVPYWDIRSENRTYMEVREAADIISYKNNSTVFVYYANGKASEPGDHHGWPNEDYDPSDTALYAQYEEAARELMNSNLKFDGIIISNAPTVMIWSKPTEKVQECGNMALPGLRQQKHMHSKTHRSP